MLSSRAKRGTFPAALDQRSLASLGMTALLASRFDAIPGQDAITPNYTNIQSGSHPGATGNPSYSLPRPPKEVVHDKDQDSYSHRPGADHRADGTCAHRPDVQCPGRDR